MIKMTGAISNLRKKVSFGLNNAVEKAEADLGLL